MLINYDQEWVSQDSGWYAKVNRAAEHIDMLRHQVDEFREGEPYTVIPEPTDRPGRRACRLHTTPVPIRIGTTVGDVLHNLRASLDNLAFGIAKSVVGDAMTPKLERASAFPICKTPEAFEEFFERRYSKERSQLYDVRARSALRAVQPFVNLEWVTKVQKETEKSYDEAARYSELYRLDKLWNIDKHRHLTLMALWPDIIYSSAEPAKQKIYPGEGTFKDGSILYYTEGADEHQDSKIVHEYNLVITDDPGFSPTYPGNTDVVELLESWHSYIVNSVFPVIFTMISSNDFDGNKKL